MSMLRTSMTSSGTRPPISQRRRTGQIPTTSTTAGKQAAFLPSNEIKIFDRPATGLSTGQSGNTSSYSMNMNALSGRQVQDANYFRILLRKKFTELSNEISKLKSDTEKLEHTNNEYQSLETTFEDTMNDVKTLEGTLADYNLAMDKLRSGVDCNEIVQYQDMLSTDNQRLADQIDHIFLSRQELEGMNFTYEQEIAHFYESIEEMFYKNDNPSKVHMYHDTMNKKKQLYLEGQECEKEIEQLQGRIHDVELSMRRGSVTGNIRKQFKDEESKKIFLHNKMSQLKEDLDLEVMDPKEAHETLLNTVKENQQGIRDTENRILDINSDLSRLKSFKKELQSDISSHIENHKNYEETMHKEKEILSSLEDMDQTMNTISEKQSETKSSIVSLLERISNGTNIADDGLPTREYYEDLKDEVASKVKNLEVNLNTIMRLQEQKAKRLEELERIEKIDDRIDMEMQNLYTKKENMKSEMVHFNTIRDLQVNAEETKSNIEGMMVKYTAKTKDFQDKNKAASIDVESNQKFLDSSKIWRELENLENKIQSQEQNMFKLTEFVTTRGRQTDYDVMKHDCFHMVESLNIVVLGAI